MPIKPTYNKQAIDRKVEELAARQRAAIVERLKAIGEQCVNEARNLPSLSRDNPAALKPHQPNYIDDTGNLRSSIGYLLLADGRAEKEYFPGRGEGADRGKELAAKVAAAHPSGFVLVVVAGMEYAKYVSDKGYDVLDTARLTAERLLRNLMAKMRK